MMLVRQIIDTQSMQLLAEYHYANNILRMLILKYLYSDVAYAT